MESLKIDRTKLKKVSTYAKLKGVDRRTIYNWIDEGKLKTEIIDGVIFIYQ